MDAQRLAELKAQRLIDDLSLQAATERNTVRQKVIANGFQGNAITQAYFPVAGRYARDAERQLVPIYMDTLEEPIDANVVAKFVMLDVKRLLYVFREREEVEDLHVRQFYDSILTNVLSDAGRDLHIALSDRAK